ncbi:hypothetical protein Q8A67_015438 [Cirrhinus molitorella]|uniref:Uncharacterized protein n=1 Tax=Cirrhinus molitorella TaxID=172907 RepID=A0AA88TK34_9TELE|nr:hypothetical protein Q8A67_015438 [Cirrhinus molitorella]
MRQEFTHGVHVQMKYLIQTCRTERFARESAITTIAWRGLSHSDTVDYLREAFALSFGSGFVHGVLAEDWRLLPRSTSTRLNTGGKPTYADLWMHRVALSSTACGPATQNSSQI